MSSVGILNSRCCMALTLLCRVGAIAKARRRCRAQRPHEATPVLAARQRRARREIIRALLLAKTRHGQAQRLVAKSLRELVARLISALRAGKLPRSFSGQNSRPEPGGPMGGPAARASAESPVKSALLRN